MKDKKLKEAKQRAKRKAKSKAFFERLAEKRNTKPVKSSFNKMAWTSPTSVNNKATKHVGFNTKAWNIGNNDG